MLTPHITCEINCERSLTNDVNKIREVHTMFRASYDIVSSFVIRLVISYLQKSEIEQLAGHKHSLQCFVVDTDSQIAVVN